jgi:hypothetical protein
MSISLVSSYLALLAPVMNRMNKVPNKTAPNFVNTTGASSFVNVPKALSNVPAAIANLPQSANLAAKNAFASVNTVANNAVKSANTFMNSAATSMGSMFSDAVEPINQSIQGSMESPNSPFLTIPIMVLIGVLTIMLIILVTFRDQIAMAAELGMRKARKWWDETFGKSQATEVPPVPITPLVDQGAIERILPTGGGKEVFHVGDNKYTYSEAAPLCEAVGAKLATYDDVKKAMNNGADWCEYSWVQGQNAVFPVQESTFQKLQQGPEDQRNACGTSPGLQGGYFDNPDLRFGVACIGKKPDESDNDRRDRSKQQNLTPDALKYQKEVNNFKQHLNEIPIAPFSPNRWNA